MEPTALTHLSRHSLLAQAERVAWLPFPPAGPPDERTGVSTAHRLFVVGMLVEDMQQYQLSVMDLVVQTSADGSSTEVVPAQKLASWLHPGLVTALQVVDFRGGEVVIYTGSADGVVCRLRLQVPTSPGADPAQLTGKADVEEAALLPWLRLHSGPVTGLSVRADARRLLTVGLDGKVFVVPTDTEAGSAVVPFSDGGSMVSYHAGAWSSHGTFVTAGTMGGLEVWDVNAAGAPERRSSLSWGLTGFPDLHAAKGTERQIHCLAVHPSRPHLAATGSSAGTVAVWDLRFEAEPTRHALTDAFAGDVWQVQFDGLDTVDSAADAPPRVLFCTDDGVLGRTAATAPRYRGQERRKAAAPLEPDVVYRELASAMLGFDVNAVTGQDVAVVTDQECLVYLRRPLPHLHKQDDPAMAGAGNVLGDDDDPTIPVAERARAEDAKLRKMFSLMENEGVVNEFSCGLRKKHLLMHGSLYLFSNHMGFHSTLPFGYTKNRLIAFKDVTAIEKRLYQGRPSGIQIDYTQNGASLSDLYVRFPFRDDALRHMLALWNRAQGRVSKAVIDSGPPPGADVDSMPEKEANETADEDDVPVQVVGAQKPDTWAVKPDAAPAPSSASSVIWEGDVNTSVRGFCQRVVHPDSHFFDKYHQHRGDKEIAVSPWQAHPVIGEVRELKFISPVSAKIGPPETHVHETQRYCVYEGGNHLVLELSTVALDVPYGDHFSVECRFDVTQVQGNWDNTEGKCHAVIHLETQFSKKTMWRKAIEAGSKSANVAGMKDLMHMAQEAAANKINPAPPPGPKATTGDIVKPLAAAKGALQAVDAHVNKTGELPPEDQVQRLLAALPPETRNVVEAAMKGQVSGGSSKGGGPSLTEDPWGALIQPKFHGVPIVVLLLAALLLLQGLLLGRR